MVEACLSDLVSKLNGYLIPLIGRQFGYVFRYKTYVKGLKTEVEGLEAARDRVQGSVNEASYDGKPVYPDVEGWLESVAKTVEEARDLLERGKNAKSACFCVWVPNPVVRYPIGRKVKAMTEVIQGLHKTSTGSTFQKVYHDNTPIGIVNAGTSTARSVENNEDVKSRALIMEDVIKALGDKKVSMIGVYGPGGIGKSKLLEDIKSRVMEENLFDVVVMAKVASNQNIEAIQRDIAYQLGLKLINEESALGRADRLCKRLEADSNKNILIILDNLQKKLELKEVGIPCKYDRVIGCKLLLSSRKGEVLGTDMGCDPTFRLLELEDGEARRLFERTFGNRINNPEFEPLVDGVVKNCGGLPLFIISLAKRLRNKESTAWSDASDIEGSDLQSLVEQNYKDIEHKRIRSLFLVCALVSGTICMKDCLVYCMGFGLFEKFSKTIEKARNRLIEDVQSLQYSSMLLDSDDTEDIRMHDIFVEVAVSIASREWSALVGKEDCGFKEWSEDELSKCSVMSFPNVGIDELPEKVHCPNLRMLLLYESKPSLKIPHSFFESMEKLQVLDLSLLSITYLPSSMQFLENLKSLCLDYCSLENVTVLGKLKGLQFLSLVQSAIARLPKELGRLTKLRFLNLTGCTELKVIEPGVLGSLVNLEELYMDDSFDQWEAEDEVPRSNASLAELKKMKKLSRLYIAIPHSANLLRDLPFGKLSKHRIQIGGVWDWSGEYKESRTLKLKLDSSNLLHAEWMQRCMQITQDLHLDGLQDGNDSVHDLCVKGFQQLKNFHIQNNPSLQLVIPSTENVAFTTLESLSLKNLNKLEKICHGCLALESLNKLKIVKVDNCGEIKHLFPRSLTRIFLQLEEIEISKCHLLQQIVADAEADEDRDEKDDDPKVKSCKLRRLTLRNLPEMTSFYKNMDHSIVFFDGQQVSLPWLESLTLSELPIKEIWNSQSPADARNLKFLKVEDCAFLLSIIPSNLLMKLQNLEVIKVKRCKLLGQVFDLEGLTTSKNVKILSRLTKLTLSDLPSLGCIWNKNPRRALCFQNLKALKVQNCENLRFLFSSSMARALVQIEEIEIASCKLMEEIMDVQEEESDEAVTTDTIEFTQLASLSLDELMNLQAFSSGKYRIHFPSLTSLRISGCPKMTTFSSSEGKQQPMTSDTRFQQAFGCINSGLSLPVFFNEKVFFPSLKELKLSSMCELKRIWHNKLHRQSFCELASLTVELCENLSHVFPSNSVDRLQRLNKIKVVGCPSLEALFESVNFNTDKRQKPLVLLELKKVKLLNLPKLKSDCKGTLEFPSLIKVNVRRCNSLSYLFSHATAKTLDNLEVLDVSSCNNLRGIIAMEEGKGKIIDTLKFHHLTTLKLGDLENLNSFCSVSWDGDGLHPLFDEKLVFPELEELHIKGIQVKELWSNKILTESFSLLKVLKVKHCHNLLNVIPSFMWKRLLHYMESLTVESCTLLKGIHTLEGLSVIEREAASNSPLKELSLCDLPNLTYIWKNEDLLNLCFHNLTSIRVEECPRLQNLFTMSMAKSLGQLQYLGLGGCGEMEYIVAEEKETREEVTVKIIIPQLVTLYLHNMSKLKSFCGKHISEWPSLKELTVEDCQAVEVIVGDVSCRKLEESIPLQQPLLLVEKVEFPSMESMKISQMDNMEKIWPNELAPNAFSKLKMLTVEYCEKLSFIFSSDIVLARFENLEKLTVTDCNSLEEVFPVQDINIRGARSTSYFQLRELDLRRLPKMKHVCGGLPQGALTLGHLQCIKVNECNSLKSLFPRSVAKSMTRLEELEVWDCLVEEIIQEEDGGVGTSANDLFFPRLTKLELVDLLELRSFYKNSHTSLWPLLKEVRVQHCEKMRSFSFASEIQSCQGGTTSVTQPALFSLEKVIPQLEALRLAWEDVVMAQQYFFGTLKRLYLSCYHDKDVVFPSDFLLQRFPNLEDLFLECSSFEEIFPKDAFGQGKASLKALGNLKRLRLNNLSKLRRVWKDGSLMAEILKQIEDLYIWQCPSLSIIFPSPTSFQRLTELEVENCAGLVHMGTCSAVTNLVHLTRLILRDCGKMEDVVIDDGNEAKEISFPKLEELILDRLPSLERFSPMNCTFMFPSLVRVIVMQCPKMNIFCKGALTTPQLDGVLLSEEDDEGCWEGDLNTTIQTLLA